MKHNPGVAGLPSLAVPGLGQIDAGETDKGGAIVAATIVRGNLDIIILPLIAMANPISPLDIAGRARCTVGVEQCFLDLGGGRRHRRCAQTSPGVTLRSEPPMGCRRWF